MKAPWRIQAQWQVFPALLLVTAGALGAIAISRRARDDAQRMRENSTTRMD